jgi:hypothetical protein
MGAVDEIVIALDATVMACKVLIDEEDTRPLADKLSGVMHEFDHVGAEYGPRIAEYLANLDQAGTEALVARFARTDYVSFVRRSIGSGAFHRLHVAFTEDCDVIAAACYQGIEACLPYAVAVGDVADMLTEEQIAAVLDFNPAGGATLALGLKVLDLVDVTLEKITLPEHLVVMHEIRHRSASAEDVLELTQRLRSVLSGQSRALVAELSGTLDRKLEGARHALEFSVDSVSQSANSLIEFIDRLLRGPFTEQEVVEWCAQNYADTPDLSYVTAATATRPTKRGQALCLLYGGLPITDPSPLHLLVASSVTAVRGKLQSLKHSDEGTPDEVREVESCLRGIEAFVTLGLQLAWSTLPDETLRDLQSRLDPSASMVVQGEVG